MKPNDTASFLGAGDCGAEFWLRGPHILADPTSPRYSPGRFLCNLAHFNRYVRHESCTAHKRKKRVSS